ncbi:hypothetical protein SD78_1729 [Bacillus badius]|nr:hypothetical protein SD78_1729 [Bacillus badius]
MFLSHTDLQWTDSKKGADYIFLVDGLLYTNRIKMIYGLLN